MTDERGNGDWEEGRFGSKRSNGEPDENSHVLGATAIDSIPSQLLLEKPLRDNNVAWGPW